MQPPMTAAEFYEQELTMLKQLWEAGNWIALFDAVNYCQTVDLRLPEWTALAVLNVIQDHYHAGAQGNEGRHGSVKGRLTMDYAHFLRYRALKFALQIRGLTAMPARRGRPAPGVVTAPALLKEAQDWLKGRKEARLCDVRQIANSYCLVEKSLSRGEARFKFDHLITLL